jgi:hypothetical protein
VGLQDEYGFSPTRHSEGEAMKDVTLIAKEEMDKIKEEIGDILPLTDTNEPYTLEVSDYEARLYNIGVCAKKVQKILKKKTV